MEGWSNGGVTRRGLLGAGATTLAALGGCSGLPVLGGDCRLADVEGAWAQPGRDAGHTAYAPDASGPAEPTVAWRTSVADARSPRTVGVAAADGVLYAVGIEQPSGGDGNETGLDGFYRSFDAADGAQGADRVGMDSAAVAGPVVARERERTLYLGRDDDGTDVRMEPHGDETGVLGRDAAGRAVAAPVLAPDGDRVYVAGPGGVVGFALSGARLFRRGLDGRPRSPPAAVDGTVYVAARGGGLYALDARSGEPRWHDERPAMGPPVVRDGAVYVRNGHRLRAFATDGSERWTVGVPGDRTGPPAATDGLLVHTSRTTAYGRRPDGSLVWRTAVENRPLRQPLAARGRLYVPGATGVTALDPATGERLWRHGTGLVASPALVGGALFLPRPDGALAALGAC